MGTSCQYCVLLIARSCQWCVHVVSILCEHPVNVLSTSGQFLMPTLYPIYFNVMPMMFTIFVILMSMLCHFYTNVLSILSIYQHCVNISQCCADLVSHVSVVLTSGQQHVKLSFNLGWPSCLFWHCVNLLPMLCQCYANLMSTSFQISKNHVWQQWYNTAKVTFNSNVGPALWSLGVNRRWTTSAQRGQYWPDLISCTVFWSLMQAPAYRKLYMLTWHI